MVQHRSESSINFHKRLCLMHHLQLTSMPMISRTPYWFHSPHTISRITVFKPGQSPPHVTTQALTSSGSKYTCVSTSKNKKNKGFWTKIVNKTWRRWTDKHTFSIGPARRKCQPCPGDFKEVTTFDKKGHKTSFSKLFASSFPTPQLP